MTALYRCRVVDADGRPRTLERPASSPESLAQDLRREGLALVDCAPAPARRHRRLTQAQVLEFTEALELLFAQNLSIKDAIGVLKTVETRPALRELVNSLQLGIEKGLSMAKSLEPFESSFPPIYLGMVRVGELAGTLGTVLPRLKRYLAARKAIRDKVLGSLAYPALIMAVLVAGMALLSAFVLPTFLNIARSLGGPSGESLGRRLAAFQTAFACILAAIPLAALGVGLARRNAAARLAMDRLLIAGSPFRRFVAPMELQGVCFALEALLESGYAVEQALGECARVTGNRALSAALLSAREAARKGTRLSAAIRSTGVFPETFCSWIAVGEEAHDLKPAFGRLRAYYEGEFDKMTRVAMALVEPALILLVGAVLVVVIVQFIGPIYGLLGGVA